MEIEIAPHGICDLCRATGITPIDPTVHRIVSGDIIMMSLCLGHVEQLRKALFRSQLEAEKRKRGSVREQISRALLGKKCASCIK